MTGSKVRHRMAGAVISNSIGTDKLTIYVTRSFCRNFSGGRFWFGISSAGLLSQLEIFQKPLKVAGRTLGNTPLGIFYWLEVIDFDPFLGFLLLALHAC